MNTFKLCILGRAWTGLGFGVGITDAGQRRSGSPHHRADTAAAANSAKCAHRILPVAAYGFDEIAVTGR